MQDCTNPTTTCKYCKSYDHVIEECPILQARWQEKRPQMGSHNVQLIGVEDRTPEHKLDVVTQSGLATDGAQSSVVKKLVAEWVWKSTNKPSTFDLKKQKDIFLQAQRDFGDAAPSCSKTIDKEKG